MDRHGGEVPADDGGTPGPARGRPQDRKRGAGQRLRHERRRHGRYPRGSAVETAGTHQAHRPDQDRDGPDGARPAAGLDDRLAPAHLARPQVCIARRPKCSTASWPASVRPRRFPRDQSPGGASSAYLRSAAHQPIDWYPWGEAAFAAARAEDKPILLDIGAVWCHWCHVMDARVLREPGARRAPQPALHLHQGGPRRAPRRRHPLPARGPGLTGQGGWPLTAFLTPDGEAFFGGTYFPAGRPLGPPRLPSVLASRAPTASTKRGCWSGRRSRSGAAMATQAPISASPRRSSWRRADGRARLLRVLRRGTAASARSRNSRIPRPGSCSSTLRRSTERVTAGCGRDHARAWPAAASTTSSPAASTATAWTALDRAALREDELRQLRAAPGLCRGRGILRRSRVRRGGPGHRPVGAGGAGRSGGRVWHQSGRRHRPG